jgi:hypothetical protein
MAEEQVGVRKDDPRELPAWMKLFSGFKVALDPKKLLLAAGGILMMALGWWVLALIFFDVFSGKAPPTWEEYKGADSGDWKAFKVARIRWNLRYEMAGVPPAEGEPWKYDAADLAGSAQEYDEIKKEKEKIEGEISKRTRKVYLGSSADWSQYWLEVGKPAAYTIPFKTDETNLEALKKLTKSPTTVQAEDIVLDTGIPEKYTATVKGIPIEIPKEGKANADKLAKDLRESKSIADIEQEIRNKQRSEKPEISRKALELIKSSAVRYKPYGRLRTWPWFEDRGPNPYLLITGRATTYGDDGVRPVPWERGEFFAWVARDQVPVLIEPLVKFLRPIVYLFDPGAGGWNRLYLILVVLWTLLSWGLFGGAITRMAAVQVARPNEKVGMTEAFRFASSRYKSFFSAPLFPLLFLLVLTVFLIIFGLVQEWTFFFGDIFVAGLFWPLVLLVGLIMAVVLVGLVGWPLMYSTISAEGSDSFDAISRSYSYVYQAPWQYLWYSIVAIVYGAVLVFFVGLMGSLMVYLGKWGVSRAPTIESREPTYLFVFAPTSYGWRDLLLYNQPETETVPVVHNSGTVGQELTLSKTYRDSMTWHNYVGAILVSIWIYILFLMVVGFGYSYFWCAGTIIYLLMRRKVDDTEMDEVHLEEEEFEEPAPRPSSAAATTAPAADAAGGRTMVEAPTLRTPATPAPATVPPNIVVPPSPPPAAKTQLATEPPVSAAPKTQLATEPLMEGKDGASATGAAEPPSSSSEGGAKHPPSEPPPEEGKP